MNKLILSNLKRTKLSSFLFILAMAIILIIIPLCFNFLKDTHSKIKTDITYYSRGSYDILVRPKSSIQSVEKEFGIVPENYLGTGDGGISVQQWEQIKKRKDIEIAAPVASLGYYTGINTNLGVDPLPKHSSRYIVNYYTSDGIKRYPLKPSFVKVFLESSKSGQEFETIYNNVEAIREASDVAPLFPIPSTYHLLVGIDPDQEEALTGIPFKDIKDGTAASGFGSMVSGPATQNATIIPVAQLENGDVSLETDIKVAQLPIDVNKTLSFRKEFGLDKNTGYTDFINFFGSSQYNRFFKNLERYPAVKETSIQANLSSILQPFNYKYVSVKVSENGKVNVLEPDGIYKGMVDLSYSSEYFTAGQLKYKKSGNNLSVKRVGKQNGVPIYRSIESKGDTVYEAINKGKELHFIIDPVASFNTGKRTEQLASSPLGIYQLAPVTYIGNGKRIQMTATTTPGSFVPAPAKGVTNIQSAAKIKGDKPIDAIRVKVAGIKDYTPAAADKIGKIAKEIKKMGLEVSIVAGASPRKMKVNVEGIGWVEEAWTSLGASGSILSQWNVTNIILMISFLLVTITYVYHRIKIWKTQKLQDITLLTQLGWRKKDIFKLFGGEITFLTILSFIVSIFALLIIQFILQVSKTAFLFQGIIAVITIGILLLLVRSRLHHKQVLKQNKRLLKLRYKSKSLIRKNLNFYREQIISPFFQLATVSGLSSFVYLSLTKTVKQTNITLLGEYINVRTSEWHVFLIIGAYLLATITLMESIMSIMITRQREIAIFRSIGWKASHVFKLFLKETAIWTATALAIGSLASFILYSIFYPVQGGVVIALTITFASFYSIILLISGMVISHYLKNEIGDSMSLRRKKRKQLRNPDFEGKVF